MLPLWRCWLSTKIVFFPLFCCFRIWQMPSVHSARWFVFVFVCSVSAFEKKKGKIGRVCMCVCVWEGGSVCLWCICGIVQNLIKVIKCSLKKIQPIADEELFIQTNRHCGNTHSSNLILSSSYLPCPWKWKYCSFFILFLFLSAISSVSWMTYNDMHGCDEKILWRIFFLSLKNPAIFSQIQELKFHCATRLTASHTHSLTFWYPVSLLCVSGLQYNLISDQCSPVISLCKCIQWNVLF